MICSKCGTPRARVRSTKPADSEQGNGRIIRQRKCTNCGHLMMTTEIFSADHRDLVKRSKGVGLDAHQRGGTVLKADDIGPLPTKVSTPLTDIEDRLEQLLDKSLDTIEKALAEDAPNRVRVELARWVISDRREYRKTLAEVSDPNSEEDPAIKQLAQVLQLVGDPE